MVIEGPEEDMIWSAYNDTEEESVGVTENDELEASLLADGYVMME